MSGAKNFILGIVRGDQQPPDAALETKKSGVTYIPYSVAVNNTNITVPILRHIDTSPPCLTSCDDPDLVIPEYLSLCGWTMKPAGVATADRVIMFLTRQLGHVSDPETMWNRLIAREIPPLVKANKTWTITVMQNDGYSFAPAFWRKLFKGIECRINPEMFKYNRVLHVLSEFAMQHKICPDTRILPFAFLRALVGRNLYDVLRDRKFQTYLFGKVIEDRYAFSLASMISNMKIDGGDQSRHEYEDAWVILLATSFFRKVPFIPDAGNNGLVPVLVSVLERDARRQALEAEAARRRMEEQEAAYVVGQPNDCMAGSSSSYSSYTSSYSQSSNCAGSVDAPNERSSALIIPNYEIPADMPLMSIAPPPEQPKVIVLLGFFRDITKLPEYECYKSAETEKVTDIVDLLGVLKQPPKASEDKVAFLRNVGHDPAFEELFKRYCAAGGLNSFANPVWLFHSLVTCFLGGDRWVELHEKLFPEYANSLKNTSDVRRALGGMSRDALIKILEMSVNVGAQMVPDSVQDIIHQFSMRIGSRLKANIRKNCIKMMLVLYYEPWVAVSGAISSEQLWKDVFMWSYDETVDDAIEAWKKEHPRLPTAIRAYALWLMHSVA